MKSILQDEKECYICHTTQGLHLHHIFFGTANRKLSDRDGCTVWLCQYHHTGDHGVHFNREKDLQLKKECQKAWMLKYNKTESDFIARYGRNYYNASE